MPLTLLPAPPRIQKAIYISAVYVIEYENVAEVSRKYRKSQLKPICFYTFYFFCTYIHGIMRKKEYNFLVRLGLNLLSLPLSDHKVIGFEKKKTVKDKTQNISRNITVKFKRSKFVQVLVVT